MIEIEKPKIECVEDPANGTYGKFTEFSHHGNALVACIYFGNTKAVRFVIISNLFDNTY